jgi:hypothetical protein
MKTCNKCHLEKPLDQFNKNAAKRDGKQTFCRDCQRAQYKQYYESDDSPERARVRRSNEVIRKLKRDYVVDMKNVPCTDCGVRYPSYVMDFDHLYDKDGDISSMLNFWNLEKIREEVEKCEVVCANCHRQRTYARREAA